MSFGGITLPLTRQILRWPAVAIRGLTNSAPRHSAYDSDGKTTATILNQEDGAKIMIDSYSTNGFRLNNGVFVVGPMALFPSTVISWNIGSDYEISEESLKLFTLLEPKLDILVIGYSDRLFNRSTLDKDLLKLRVKHKLNIELLLTDRAIATYNFLASESRWVAAALIPPKLVNLTDEDMATARKTKNHEYLNNIPNND